jgi:deoxyxylulose-5-phosphate synthase
LISIEDNVILGGGGSAISEYLHQQKITTPLQISGAYPATPSVCDFLIRLD